MSPSDCHTCPLLATFEMWSSVEISWLFWCGFWSRYWFRHMSRLSSPTAWIVCGCLHQMTSRLTLWYMSFWTIIHPFKSSFDLNQQHYINHHKSPSHHHSKSLKKAVKLPKNTKNHPKHIKTFKKISQLKATTGNKILKNAISKLEKKNATQWKCNNQAILFINL